MEQCSIHGSCEATCLTQLDEMVPQDMDDEQIREIIERCKAYFPPLPFSEIRVHIVSPSDEHLFCNQTLGWMPLYSDLVMTGGRAMLDWDGVPSIWFAEGFDTRFPEDVVIDMILHEFSHLVDLGITGYDGNDLDPIRWQITSYIMEQEGWL